MLSFFVLVSNLSAQKISFNNSRFSEIESTNDYVLLNNKIPYNDNVPFFTRMKPSAEAEYEPEFYGMSMQKLYYASSTRIYAVIELLKVDTEKLSVDNTKYWSKTPYVRVYALNDEESWNTSNKKDGNEIQETQEIFVFDTEAQAQKFIEELKTFVKVSQLYRQEAWKLKQQPGFKADANTAENSKKRIKLLEQIEALIAGKKYTQLEVILVGEKYEQYSQNISNLIEHDMNSGKYIPKKDAPKDAPKQIYDNFAKMKAIRKSFEAKYKTFKENFYPEMVRNDWYMEDRLNIVNRKGGLLEDFPATLAEYEAIVAKIQGEKQQANKSVENANATDVYGNSPLMNAIKTKDLEKVKSLIKSKADVKYKNPKTNTSVLKYAFEVKDIPIVKEIMEYEDIKTEFKYSSYGGSKVYHEEVMYVIEKNDAELYKLFETRQGAYQQVKPDYTDKDGNYPFMMAYNLGNSQQAEMIFRFSGENNPEKQRQKDGYTLLMMAIEKNDIAFALKIMLPNGINLMNNDGYTPLMMAAERGQKEVVEAILGKDVFTKNSSGEWVAKSYDPNFVSDKGKMKGKKAIDVAKNKEIKKLLTKK